MTSFACQGCVGHLIKWNHTKQFHAHNGHQASGHAHNGHARNSHTHNGHLQNGEPHAHYLQGDTKQYGGRTSFPTDKCDVRQRYDMSRDVNDNSVQQKLLPCDTLQNSNNVNTCSQEVESQHVLDIYCRFLFPFLYGLAMLIYFLYMTNQPSVW